MKNSKSDELEQYDVENGYIKNFLAGLADSLNKHYLVKSIIQLFPTIWTPVIMTGLGETLKLKTDKGLSIIGWLGVIAVYGTSLGITMLANFKLKRDTTRSAYSKSVIDGQKSEIELHREVSLQESDSERARLDIISKNANDVIDGANAEIAAYIKKTFDPEQHLIIITQEIAHCFQRVTRLRENDLYISMAVTFDGQDEAWHWVYDTQIDGGADLQVLKKPGSTFFRVYSKQTTYQYYNDKKEACRQGCYIMDSRDISHGGCGSIICWGVTIRRNDKELVQMIMSISTYGKKITNKTDLIDVLYDEKIRKVILEQFANEIRLDLTLYYIIKHSLNCSDEEVA